MEQLRIIKQVDIKHLSVFLLLLHAHLGGNVKPLSSTVVR